MRGSSCAVFLGLLGLGCGASEVARPAPGGGPLAAVSAVPVASTDAPAPTTAVTEKPACRPLEWAAPELPPSPVDAPLPPVTDLEDRAVGRFYESLAGLLRGRRAEPVRIGFYGDSNLTLDEISGTLRRILQRSFGDAGHGYVGVGSPFRGYRHRDVHRRMVGTWSTLLFSHHHPTGGGFGAGGMAAETREPRAGALFSTAGADAPVGQQASRFTVYYLEQPGGGRFAISVDGSEGRVVETNSPEVRAGVATVQVPDGEHRFAVHHQGHEPLRLLGVSLERERPGVVVNAFGITGVTYFHLARMAEPVSQQMLRDLRHDLVLFLVGTNFWRFQENPQKAPEVMALHRAARPDVSLLIMSPPDHATSRTSTGSDPRVVAVAEQLREVAEREGCAYWDLREAMGGDGSMLTFYRRGLAGPDLYHLTTRGARVMGERLAQALLVGFAEYLTSHPAAGCDGHVTSPE